MTTGLKLAGASGAVIVVILAAVLFLWSPGQPPDSEHPPMRITTYYWPGMYWIDVARDKGWFAEAGLDVEFVNANDDYYAALDAIEAGEVDTLSVWLFDVVKRSQDGTPLVMALATDQSDGSEGIVSRPSIDSMKQLKGGRVGVPLGSALVYELDVILSRFGMTLNDVTLVDIAPEKAAGILETDELDAVVTWEPYLGEAAEVGNRLYDSSRLPGLVTAGMTFRESFIEKRPQDVQQLVNVWHRTTNYIKTNQDEAFRIVAEANDVTPENAASFARFSKLMTLRDNIEAFTYASGIESLFGSARKINRFLMDRNQADYEPVTGQDVLDARFVRELAREESQQ